MFNLKRKKKISPSVFASRRMEHLNEKCAFIIIFFFRILEQCSFFFIFKFKLQWNTGKIIRGYSIGVVQCTFEKQVNGWINIRSAALVIITFNYFVIVVVRQFRFGFFFFTLFVHWISFCEWIIHHHNWCYPIQWCSTPIPNFFFMEMKKIFCEFNHFHWFICKKLQIKWLIN